MDLTMKIKNYNNKIESKMIALYNSLSEKDRRRYAAIEASKLGHGGIVYIVDLFNCDGKTIAKGIEELEDSHAMNMDRIRISGGGRKSKLETIDNIDSVFLDVLKDYTAGDPMNKDLKWTNLTKGQIKEKMLKRKIKVSRNIVRKLLKKHGFSKRKASKCMSIGQHKDRNQQFKIIEKVKAEYLSSDNPIISVDAKKKENIGSLYRDGTIECKEPIKVFDHDYPCLADGKITPYGIYDMKTNEGFVNIGTSADTSEFACDSIRIWWNVLGKHRYPNATSILILSDAGGSNSYRTHIYKFCLQKLANELGFELRIAHYPSYASKFNPIERRLFCHITASLSGSILTTVVLAKELIKNTATQTGLKVFARISNKIYEKGKEVADDFYETAKITHDAILGFWNYVVSPM